MTFPRSLDSYPAADAGLWQTLVARAAEEPFNVVASAVFLVAIVHTFLAPAFRTLAHRVQHRHDARARAERRPPGPSVAAEALHFFGEVEVVFGLWAAVLLASITLAYDWHTATHYVGETVNYAEPIFVVVIMTLASTRPVVALAEGALRQVARLGNGSLTAWWLTILLVGPMLGSLITEPGAMTISALLLARRFYDLEPSDRFKYATLGLLFVNVSIGGALTHFAAPPILMVAAPWQWDVEFVFAHVGAKAVLGLVVSTAAYAILFRPELRALSARAEVPDVDVAEEDDSGPVVLLPVPAWVTCVHVLFMAWTVVTAHYPALFVGGFLFFLGFAKATAPFQSRIELKSPLLVGFFLAGLVIHGGLQGWWIAPVLGSLPEFGLYVGAAVLTAFNDNALITYLATLVPDLSQALQIAVVQGAITGGGLTVIANAPNPAGQAILLRFFNGAISPVKLFLAALLPTLLAAAAFRLL